MEDIAYFYPQGHQAHYETGHPERPDRVETLVRALDQKSWWQPYPKLAPVPVSTDLMQQVHQPRYLQRLSDACKYGDRLDADTYTTTASLALANQAAGGAVALARAVWLRQARRGFALTRPPGHHATRQQGMGFCLLNNIAIAAQDLLQNAGAERLAIVDLDLHHGNGTQDIFWERSDVLFISTHQSPLYPGSGDLTESGGGAGEGWTVNIPLPPGSGDQAFQTVMDQLILPLLERSQPEMLLVSFGFDPHWLDPLGHLRLSAQKYGQLIAQLGHWAERNCQGRLALFLEGGYDLQAGAACAQAVVAALLDQPYHDDLGPSPRGEGGSWAQVVEAARTFWQC